MRITRVIVTWYRSVQFLEFEVGPFTVLFGKNNAGKTNLLEAIYGIFAPSELPGHFAGETLARGVRGPDDQLPPAGSVIVQLEPGRPFDDELLEMRVDEDEILADCVNYAYVDVVSEHVALRLDRLPAAQVAFNGQFSFSEDRRRPGLNFYDPEPFWRTNFKNALAKDEPLEVRYDHQLSDSFESLVLDGPRPMPLFLDWQFEDLDQTVTTAISSLLKGPEDFDSILRGDRNTWLEPVSPEDDTWRIRPAIDKALDDLCFLATSLLPDFIDGSIGAYFQIPDEWQQSPRIAVSFEERIGRPIQNVSDVGRGPARWIAASIQVALHLLKHRPGIRHEISAGGPFDSAANYGAGHVLFVDEPEAHLHASAVESIVRWCHRMVGLGFNVVVASHHEEFLRSPNEEQVLVHVTRDTEAFHTNAVTLPSKRSTRLLELATDVGMHPAAALSIRRAILFVEGPLDEAVLDEYAGLELDAAGVKIISIHGTRNLEGLVAVELVTDLGIKNGILTDATDPSTMHERSNKKRSSEEKKLIRVMDIAREKGLPAPTIFGVPEDDLLFALPAEAIRGYLQGPFPGWKDLVAECRQSLAKTPSDSVDWKTYAEERYGLRITSPGGVREVVRALDLQNVPLPSIRTVVDQIVEWANAKNE